ncbi:hypothetical protein Acr_24g0010580 [Actinidia rufa]|uniref:Dirigent protein n=1 Tax=Actinidia rufa TaxID=165716 RepID=A0A7J0GVS5_9ERIC|nr:hypothetical protein Acr_24g0010580 [Actinidia rufa]
MNMLMKLFYMPTIPFFFLFLIIINQSLSSRILSYPSPTHHHTHHSLTFYMLDSLTEPCPSSSPVTTKVLNGQLSFPKPLGFFPPAGGIPLPDPNPNLSTQTLDLPGIGISFLGKAALEELEFGMVTVIDEALFEGTFGLVQVGKTRDLLISGTGKYHNANGYATIMTVNLGSTNLKKESEGANKVHKFNVFLS